MFRVSRVSISVRFSEKQMLELGMKEEVLYLYKIKVEESRIEQGEPRTTMQSSLCSLSREV